MAGLSGAGLNTGIRQVASAHNVRAGTVRGLHYQVPPDEECKFIWCQSGLVFDVLVDLRPSQPTYGRWLGVTLTGGEARGVYIPSGVAHGYQTLEDHSSLLYLITAEYRPESARSLRWDDPSVGIEWPMPARMISERDATAPQWPPAR